MSTLSCHQAQFYQPIGTTCTNPTCSTGMSSNDCTLQMGGIYHQAWRGSSYSWTSHLMWWPTCSKFHMIHTILNACLGVPPFSINFVVAGLSFLFCAEVQVRMKGRDEEEWEWYVLEESAGHMTWSDTRLSNSLWVTVQESPLSKSRRYRSGTKSGTLIHI